MTPPAEAKLKKNVVFFTGRMPVLRVTNHGQDARATVKIG